MAKKVILAKQKERQRASTGCKNEPQPIVLRKSFEERNGGRFFFLNKDRTNNCYQLKQQNVKCKKNLNNSGT